MKFAEQVLRAYKETGLLPTANNYLAPDGKVCGISCWLLNQGKVNKHQYTRGTLARTASCFFKNAMCLQGFISGFDNLKAPSYTRNFIVWEKIGRESRNLLVANGYTL